MPHRHDYVEFERSPPSKSAARATGAAAEADGDASASAAAVVPLLLGRLGQQVAQAGETGAVGAHEVPVLQPAPIFSLALFVQPPLVERREVEVTLTLQVTQKLDDEAYD